MAATAPTKSSPEEILKISAAEEAFDVWRRRSGFVLGPLAFAAVYWSTFSDLSEEAHSLAAVIAAVIVLWLTEAIPMPVTAMAGVALAVALGVAPPAEAFSSFANPLMFVFIGSFMIARAVFAHGLDRRVAYSVLSLGWIAGRPERILLGFGLTTAVLSGWMSNTAATAMMLPIGLSILAAMFSQSREDGKHVDPRFATGLMLMTSFASSIGGLATPIGTPPNLIGLRYIRDQINVEFSFLEWMMLGVPVTAVMFLFLYRYLLFFCPPGVKRVVGSREIIKEELRNLGPWTIGQASTAFAFLATVFLWILPGAVGLVLGNDHETARQLTASLPEAVVAVFGASLLFVLPGGRQKTAITWRQAAEIDWGVILLFGGGIALGDLAMQTGLTDVIGESLADYLSVSSVLELLIVATAVAALTSETTSNTASATIIVPIVIALAQSSGINPVQPALGATLGASLGFMLPVSTPSNAIVYGSGYIPLIRMVKYGLLLDLAGIVVIVVLVSLMGPLLQS